MFYLFDEDGNTSTFCSNSACLFDMFAVETDEGEKTLSDNYNIKEHINFAYIRYFQ